MYIYIHPLKTQQVGAGEKRKKKVLILMSDTGGGHRASAQALEAAFDELFPNQIECSTVDIWTDFAPWPYNQVKGKGLIGRFKRSIGGSSTDPVHPSTGPPPQNNRTAITHRTAVRAGVPVHGQEPLLLEGLLGVRKVSPRANYRVTIHICMHVCMQVYTCTYARVSSQPLAPVGHHQSTPIIHTQTP